MSPIGVDPTCYELADNFLADLPAAASPEQAEATRRSLAEQIQRTVDEWFADWEANPC